MRSIPVTGKFLFALILLILTLQIAEAQGTAGAGAAVEPRYLIDIPTAGIISHGSFALDMDFYQSGGVLAELSVGLFDRMMIGASYGGANLLGTEKPSWNKSAGFAMKIRVLDETVMLPALALGFDSQGRELFLDAYNRYSIKSLGFYAVASKNYQAWGSLSFHGGANYSLERDDDSDPNFFGGVDKSLGPFASLIAEYNVGMNDSNRDALGRGRGYLNIGFRASVGNGFTIGFNFKDILNNQQETGNRTIRLEFVDVR